MSASDKPRRIVDAVTAFTQCAAIDPSKLEHESLAYRLALVEQYLARHEKPGVPDHIVTARAAGFLGRLAQDAARDNAKVKALVRADIAATP